MEAVTYVLENCTAYIMEVLKNLLGNNTKINAKEIAAIFEGSPRTLDTILELSKIEHGGNENGQYVLLSDGTQMCWVTTVLSYSRPEFLAKIWTFPKSFLATYPVSGHATRKANWDSLKFIRGHTSVTCTERTGETRMYYPTDQVYVSGDTAEVNLFAIGRWK